MKHDNEWKASSMAGDPIPDRPDQWHWRDGQLHVPPDQKPPEVPPGQKLFLLGEILTNLGSAIMWLMLVVFLVVAFMACGVF